MQTAEFNHEDFDSKNQSALDEKLLVKFFHKTRPDPVETEKAGRPMFKEVVYVDIRVPGNNSGGACRPARQTDIERFPRHYSAFKNRVEAPVEGTPLSEWPLITRSMVDTFAFMNVKTVEQLADLNDTYATQVMGGLTFKQKAKEYLVYAEELKDIEDKKELKAKNQKLTEQVESQSEMISQMKARLDKLEAPTAQPKNVKYQSPDKTSNPLECKCGKICKSANGLKVHQRSCKKKKG